MFDATIEVGLHTNSQYQHGDCQTGTWVVLKVHSHPTTSEILFCSTLHVIVGKGALTHWRPVSRVVISTEVWAWLGLTRCQRWLAMQMFTGVSRTYTLS